MYPLVPLGVASSIGLLVLGFEHSHHLPLGITSKVTTGAALGDHAGVDALGDGSTDAADYILELGLGHDTGLGGGEAFGRERSDSLGGLKDRVMDLERLLAAGALFMAFETACNVIGPALESSVNGFEVDAAAAAAATVRLWPSRGGFRGMHARVTPRLGNRGVTRGGSRLQGSVGV